MTDVYWIFRIFAGLCPFLVHDVTSCDPAVHFRNVYLQWWIKNGCTYMASHNEDTQRHARWAKGPGLVSVIFFSTTFSPSLWLFQTFSKHKKKVRRCTALLEDKVKEICMKLRHKLIHVHAPIDCFLKKKVTFLSTFALSNLHARRLGEDFEIPKHDGCSASLCHCRH